MSKISIISNSYTARNLIYHIDYLFNNEISTVFLLRENHCYTETFAFQNNVSVVICESLDICVQESDFILLLKDENISARSIKRVETSAKLMGKELVIIENPWAVKIQSKENEPVHENSVADKALPLILLISIGEYTQRCCVELMLSRLLSNQNARVHQSFSSETYLLLSRLTECGLINDKLRQISNGSDHGYDVAVKSITDDLETSQNSIDISRTIIEYQPNYIILNTNHRMEINQKLIKLLELKYYRKINCVIKSQYAPIVVGDTATPVLICGKNDKRRNNTFNISSKTLPKWLRNDIIPKIALPRGVSIIS